MKFSGELIVNAPREAVFDKLKDAPFFASCVEGVHDLVEVSPTQYTALFDTKIAYIKFKFEVAVELTRAERPVAIAAKIEGKPHGIVGRLSATSAATFVEEGDATKIPVEAGDDDLLPELCEPLDDLRKPLVEELALLDGDDVRIGDGVLDLGRGVDGDGPMLRAGA